MKKGIFTVVAIAMVLLLSSFKSESYTPSHDFDPAFVENLKKACADGNKENAQKYLAESYEYFYQTTIDGLKNANTQKDLEDISGEAEAFYNMVNEIMGNCSCLTTSEQNEILNAATEKYKSEYVNTYEDAVKRIGGEDEFNTAGEEEDVEVECFIKMRKACMENNREDAIKYYKESYEYIANLMIKSYNKAKSVIDLYVLSYDVTNLYNYILNSNCK